MTANEIIQALDRLIATNLRKYRIFSGVSLQNVARELGVSYQQMQKYETHKDRISPARLYKASIILETDIRLFFEGTEENINNLILKKEFKEQLELNKRFHNLNSKQKAEVLRFMTILQSSNY